MDINNQGTTKGLYHTLWGKVESKWEKKRKEKYAKEHELYIKTLRNLNSRPFTEEEKAKIKKKCLLGSTTRGLIALSTEYRVRPVDIYKVVSENGTIRPKTKANLDLEPITCYGITNFKAKRAANKGKYVRLQKD